MIFIGDGTDLPFKVGRRLEKLLNTHTNGISLSKLTSTHRLIMQAMHWENVNEIVVNTPIRAINLPILQTVGEIKGGLRPRRLTAIAAVQNAVRAGESTIQKRNRERREAAAANLVAAEAANALEEQRMIALEAEAESQANNFLTTVDGWRAHIVS